MRSIPVLAAALMLLAACTEPKVEAPPPPSGQPRAVLETGDAVPKPVARTHAALWQAAESRNWTALERLLPADDRFRYSWGGAEPGGPLGYWRRENKKVFEELRYALAQPAARKDGQYWWPALFAKSTANYTAEDRRYAVERLGRGWEREIGLGTPFVGYRVWIDPDGTWRGFISGD